MTEVKTVDVIVERDPMTKIPKTILGWELDVLREKYPGKIEVIGHGTTHVDGGLPDAESEANRMRDLHGADNKTGDVFFDSVYGKGRAGIAEFEKVIHAARVKPVKHAKPTLAQETAGDKAAGTGTGSGDDSGESKDPLA